MDSLAGRSTRILLLVTLMKIAFMFRIVWLLFIPVFPDRNNENLKTDIRLQPWNEYQHFSQGNNDEPPHMISSSYESNGSGRNGALGHELWMTQLTTNIISHRVMDLKKALQTLTRRK
ncbi:hypothetical protein BGZ96_011743 [Linnemannia gamsii]|uniref:Uncharacterized protein n=1 Tax=Linnemannia gamsii TaxID=64522 RepID=A0ABQ7JS09_9FUNG|nr:hypothetical protein BGZ96_011743 [Linnemannia gamsii]